MSGNGSATRPRREPHWVVVLIIGVVVGLLLTWLGINDWRFPWVQASSSSTAPVKAVVHDSGGVDVTWSAVDLPDVDHYEVEVVAVEPIAYTYGEPFYSGVQLTTLRIYPVSELNANLAAEGNQLAVAAGQLWHVCVTAMLDTPLGEDVASYTMGKTRSCSGDFVLP